MEDFEITLEEEESMIITVYIQQDNKKVSKRIHIWVEDETKTSVSVGDGDMDEACIIIASKGISVEKHDELNVKQKCSLCKGSGIMPGYIDVEDYYRD